MWIGWSAGLDSGNTLGSSHEPGFVFLPGVTSRNGLVAATRLIVSVGLDQSTLREGKESGEYFRLRDGAFEFASDILNDGVRRFVVIRDVSKDLQLKSAVLCHGS